ncbi:MAG: nucleotidyltransferase domain-containing protein [Candidatus Thermoplasmatota archaeon]|nr:nucleotidyltransferase domain-containing protein [Candidatus Thermoplasmatota archaeon]
MLQKLFTSRTRVKLLTLFMMNPGREMYVREIARNVKENINAVRRELANLEEIDLLKSERRGNSKYYVVNKKMPIYNELASIILKTEGMAKVLQDSLSGLSVETAFIYGSFASGKAGVDSDIDTFIVGEINEEELIKEIREVEKRLSREINYVLFTAEEFERRKKRKDPFVLNVLKEPKSMLVGDLSDLR